MFKAYGKKIVAVLLCLAVLGLALYGCAGKKSTALTVGEAQVDNEVFAYFFDKAYNTVESEGGDLLDTAAIIDYAVELCGEYVSAITLFGQHSLSLTAKEKVEISEKTEEEWKLYGSYYTSAGISKQTVNIINEADAKRTCLLMHYFGEGGEYEVGEEEIEYYFDQTYVQFQAINGYLTTTNEFGETVALTDEEKQLLRDDFETKKQQLESGLSLAEVNGGTDVEPSFVAVTNAAYPEGFLLEVAKLENDKPAIIEIDDYIFLVIRQDAKSGEENYFKSYLTSYIEALRGEQLTDMLVATMEDYDVERDERKLEKAAEKLVEARNKRK